MRRALPARPVEAGMYGRAAERCVEEGDVETAADHRHQPPNNASATIPSQIAAKT
jgi:hypothetical protein